MPTGIYDRTKSKPRDIVIKSIIVNCHVCGKEIRVYPSQIAKSKTGKYTCSKKCVDEFQSSPPMTCENCGKVFKRKPSRSKGFIKKFCSLICQKEYKAKTSSKIVQCAYCGKDIKRGLSIVAIRTNNFCNHECRANYAKTGNTVKCDWCNKEIYKPINRTFKLNFCSQDCRFAYIINNAMGRLPYPPQWQESLREQVRHRDNNVCQLCLKPNSELSHKLHVHHIDCDKENCDMDNLISLHHGCHAKVGNTPLKEVLKYEAFIEDFINNPYSASM
jgi:ribosomal protein L24E